MSTSHDWARSLQKDAEFLLAKPEVEIGNIPKTANWLFSQKEAFLNLVRATKPGRKNTTESYIYFYPKDSNLEILVGRNLFCKRLNPEYECEPLLSKEEDAEMEASV
jgi:hypothetical protein